jgi:hypothetical protein
MNTKPVNGRMAFSKAFNLLLYLFAVFFDKIEEIKVSNTKYNARSGKESSCSSPENENFAISILSHPQSIQYGVTGV